MVFSTYFSGASIGHFNTILSDCLRDEEFKEKFPDGQCSVITGKEEFEARNLAILSKLTFYHLIASSDNRFILNALIICNFEMRSDFVNAYRIDDDFEMTPEDGIGGFFN